jgi:hypothetical protein
MADGRSTFAFEPARVSQSQPEAQGGFRGIQMQGGNTSIAGGVAAASQFTTPGPEADRIGGFLTELLQPAIERRKKEQFVAGMVDQMSAVSGEEIRVNDKNPLNTIFGPSSYEEGAIFYSAKDAVNQWQTKTLADMDKLKRLPPDQLTKVVASSFDAMKTGDRFTDLAVETSLIEASQPVIGAIAKERYKWQQGEAHNRWSGAASSGGAAFQAAATSLASNSDPSDAGNLAANAARNNFLSSLAKPEGMDDETYRKGLIGFYRGAAEGGNGYAVTALKSSGFLNLLTDEELVKLEDAELKYGNRALSRAAINFAPDIDRLNFNMEFGKISSTEAMAQLATINEKVKGATGFDIDLFDYKDVTGAGKNVWTALHAQLQRQEDRKWQVEDAARREQFELDKAEKEAADEAAQVQTAYAAGRVKTAMAAGIGATGNFDILAQKDFAAGKWDNMIRSYNNDQWVSNLVKDQVQAQITGSIGQEYNKDFEGGYRKFTTLNKMKPAAAMAYYGDLYAPMLAYERMVTTGRVSPTQAFQRAFSNPAQYAPTPDLTKEASTAIDGWIKSNRGSTWGSTLGFGRNDLTASGKAALKATMSRQLGVMMKNTDMPAEALVPNLYQDLVRSGAYEDYGRLGWSNKPGTPNLGKSLGLQQDEADEVVQSVIDRQLKATGFSDGIKGDNFDIRRIKDQAGHPMLAVTPYDDDNGAGTAALIPFAMFKDQADSTRAGRVARGQRSYRGSGTAKYNGPDPYRRIPGETGWQRIKRINNEVAAGADPVQH